VLGQKPANRANGKLSTKHDSLKKSHGKLIVSNRKRTEVLKELQDKGYDTFAKESKTSEEAASPEDDEEEI
jgi:flavin-dependent dehydrogenase